eukprot:GHVU01070654.1.p1 GENE.GHVU01070654.1~~GHVU01070654.1.p1  ORF type:complete len:102 (-),score=3.82 GHVU01070654.1:402-707(-)
MNWWVVGWTHPAVKTKRRRVDERIPYNPPRKVKRADAGHQQREQRGGGPADWVEPMCCQCTTASRQVSPCQVNPARGSGAVPCSSYAAQEAGIDGGGMLRR